MIFVPALLWLLQYWIVGLLLVFVRRMCTCVLCISMIALKLDLPLVHHMSNTYIPGVSSCYVFKSLLQEFAQKVKLPNPTYNTIKEGPSHEPSFRSTVIVNDVTYESLPGFFSRRDAEQSAAEVALKALSNSGTMGECISQPVVIVICLTKFYCNFVLLVSHAMRFIFGCSFFLKSKISMQFTSIFLI